MHLTISIVTYKSDSVRFETTLKSLQESAVQAKSAIGTLRISLYIIDNNSGGDNNVEQAKRILNERSSGVFSQIVFKTNEDNVGYGGGHNLAILNELADYYLVLNPDVILEPMALRVGLEFMRELDEVALVSPQGVSPFGEPLFLCKRFPKVFDLLLRGFAPLWLRKRFRSRIAYYEMHTLLNSKSAIFGIPIVSGCCMLLKGSKLRDVGGFDEKYFLYFEDFDLSLRVGEVGKVAYLPGMKVVHYGGRASKKGLIHIALFFRSGVRFYQRYGWRWFR